MSRARRISKETELALLCLCGALPSTLLSCVLIVKGDLPLRWQWTLLLLVLSCWLALALLVARRSARASKTAGNLLSALREGDYSIRSAFAQTPGPYGEILREINALSNTLQTQRFQSEESVALLARVMDEIDVAILAFDGELTLKLANRAASRLLGASRAALPGSTAAALGIEALLEGDTPRTVDLVLPGGSGHFELRRSAFREQGMPHQLLVLADLERALRDEERRAWQKLVRVLGHEINNSLAPIQSLSTSLLASLGRAVRPDDMDEDLTRGLSVIARRAESLGRFMSSYAQLARLPEPKIEAVNLADCIPRVIQLETRHRVNLLPGPDTEVYVDPAQLEQILINLMRNAVEAAAVTGGAVEITWHRSATAVEISVLDEGPGLAATANLFVPFFTTKPTGSGIGLALSRQIAEAHGGRLTLENRKDRNGCIATLKLPRTPSNRVLGTMVDDKETS